MNSEQKKALYWVAKHQGSAALSVIQKHMQALNSAQRRALLDGLVDSGHLEKDVGIGGMGPPPVVYTLTRKGKAYLRTLERRGLIELPQAAG